jgi:hypothetical protein
MLSRAEIVEILNREVYSADAGFAHALKEQNKAREALKRAVQRNCEFTLNGVIPEDLQ